MNLKINIHAYKSNGNRFKKEMILKRDKNLINKLKIHKNTINKTNKLNNFIKLKLKAKDLYF